MSNIIDPQILEIANNITHKRPKIVIDHIIKHGFITTEDLKNIYGYNHPPRAIRDVREHGVPIETFRVKANDGRSIAAYRFGDPKNIQNNKLGGRQVFSKKFKNDLIHIYGNKCAISLETYPPEYLQIDHRIPYEISGELSGTERTPEAFMLLCGAAQRQKSWACEHCSNISLKNLTTCYTCYWAYPENYFHIATHQERRVEIVFSDTELKNYEKLQKSSEEQNISKQEIIKKLLDENS